MDSDRFDAISRALHEARSRRGAMATALGGLVSLIGLAGVDAGNGKGGKGGGKGKGKGKKKPDCNDELNEVPCGKECCNTISGTICVNKRCCEGTNGICCAAGSWLSCNKRLCIPLGSTCCSFASGPGGFTYCAPGLSCGHPSCPGVLAP